MSATRRADGVKQVFRVDAAGVTTPVELGPAPALGGHARLR